LGTILLAVRGGFELLHKSLQDKTSLLILVHCLTRSE